MKISFIGSGKMAEAIIAALVKARMAKPSEIFSSDVSTDRRNGLKKQHGINTYGSNTLVVEKANIVFLAVKPQNLDAVMQEIAPVVSRDHLIISIAAGKRIGQIEAALPLARVIRVMPNVACLVSEAMSVFALGSQAMESDRHIARKLLSSFGRVMELPEAQFDAVTALSGSGPAFFAYLLNAMAEEAALNGMDRPDALLLAAQTMLGTARLLIEKQMEPQALIQTVASPKGTTEAGLKVLESSPTGEVLRQTIRAAVARSKELSGPH